MEPALQAVSDDIPLKADMWAVSSLNWWLMAAAIIFIILYMRQFVSTLPYMLRGMLRWRELVSMEWNMRLCRERDSVSTASAIVACACISRLGLFKAPFMEGLSPSMRTLAASGLLLGYLIIRAGLIGIVPVTRFRHDTARISDSCGRNFFILTTASLLIMLITSSISRACSVLAESASYWCIGIIWLLYMLRKYQILSSDAGHFPAILYLCTIEFIPAVMLVASVVYL